MFQFWPDHYMWSYQLVRVLVAAHYGGGDTGEMLAAATAMTPGDDKTWCREWLALADYAEGTAGGAPDLLAQAAWRRASTYHRMAGFFLQPDDPLELNLYQRGANAFRRGVPHLEAVRIPFEGAHLQAYFGVPPAVGVGTGTAVLGQTPRYRTLILMGGLESMAEEVYFAVGVAALQAGFAVLILEGPGQGGTLRLEGLFSRAAYEAPVTAAVDYLLGRPEVDPNRIGMIAYSLGGYYLCRAAAFEHRLRACVVWGADYDYGEVWQSRPDDHPLAPRVMHTLGVESMSEARDILREFHLRGVAERISAPVLIMHGEEDRHVPISHAHRTYEAIRGERDLKIYAAGRPGSTHCQWDVPHRAHHEMFSWLYRHLV